MTSIRSIALFSLTGNFQLLFLFNITYLKVTVNYISSSRAPKISVDGPLMMQPAALDNYGGDACSLLCLPVSPPVLVIANRTGNVHHAVLLPRQFSDGDGSEDSEDDDIKSRIPDDLEVLLVLIPTFQLYDDICIFFYSH